ncbi:MAG: hypothetical protein AAFP84_10875 [Actinomycetota bacterium]
MPADPDRRGRRVAVVGTGVAGERLRRRIGLIVPDADVVAVDTRRHDARTSNLLDGVDAAVLARPTPHLGDAAALVGRGIGVVSISDQVADVRALLSLGHAAERAGVPLVVGAGMSPGLSGLLARHLAVDLATIDEIRVGIHGTAGPSCARQHHRALARTSISIVDGQEVVERAGTGRELIWFPEPVGAYDCYRAEVPSPILLRESFPDTERITARMSANRRDRFTSRLPMLSPPHSEGGVGAIRIEVSGLDAAGGRRTAVAGIAELVGTAAAATAGAFLHAICSGSFEPGVVVPGSADLDTLEMLRVVERLGVRLQSFTGVPTTTGPTHG